MVSQYTRRKWGRRRRARRPGFSAVGGESETEKDAEMQNVVQHWAEREREREKVAWSWVAWSTKMSSLNESHKRARLNAVASESGNISINEGIKKLHHQVIPADRETMTSESESKLDNLKPSHVSIRLTLILFLLHFFPFSPLPLLHSKKQRVNVHSYCVSCVQFARSTRTSRKGRRKKNEPRVAVKCTGNRCKRRERRRRKSKINLKRRHPWELNECMFTKLFNCRENVWWINWKTFWLKKSWTREREDTFFSRLE